MKRLLPIIFVCTLLLFGCGDTRNALCGTWVHELYGSDLIITLTEDGKYIDGNTGIVSRYEIRGSKLFVYTDDDKSTGILLPYSVNADTLSLGTVAYQRQNDTSSLKGTP